jgi:hypothetical protein
MNSTRRQFVASTIAGLPVLMYTPHSQAQTRVGPVQDDAIMTQIEGDLVRSYNELKENPKRVDALRAFEGALRYHAAYATAANHNDAFRKALAKGIKAKGRAVFVDEVVSDTHAEHRRHAEIKRRFPGFNFDTKFSDSKPLTREQTDRVVSDLLGRGFTPALVAMADQVRLVSGKLATAQPMVQVRTATRDERDCYYAKAAVEYLSGLVGIICALAAFQPEFAAACAIAGLELAVLEIVSWIACMWI